LHQNTIFIIMITLKKIQNGDIKYFINYLKIFVRVKKNFFLRILVN